jgi:hypothetical protein
VRIIQLETGRKAGKVEITGLMDTGEFNQLLGFLDDLHVFAAPLLTQPATTIKTGAKNSYAKYLLFPVKLRRAFKTEQYDFGKVTCGTLESRQKLYVIYQLPRKM